MDRLTVKSKTPGLNHALKVMRIGYTENNCKDICSEHDFAGELHCTECGIQKAIEKLAAYEDTGLTPEEVDAMKAEYSDTFQAHLNQLCDLKDKRIEELEAENEQLHKNNDAASSSAEQKGRALYERK